MWYKSTYLQSRNRLTDLQYRFVVAKGRGENGKTGELGLVDANLYI